MSRFAPTWPSPRPTGPQRRPRRVLPALLRAAVVAVLLLGPGACQRWWPGHQAQAPKIAQRPFPELDQLSAVVADVRAILPSVPLGVKPIALGATPTQPPPEPRLVLEGEGRLLRPSTFPDLPPRMRVAVFLDPRTPPGGYLSVTDAQGTTRWRVLDAVQDGRRDAAFAITLRLSDARARLRYLVLLGVPFDAGGQHYRSLEGYVILPGPDGSLSTAGAVYPVDFGYRHPDPPPPVAVAEALNRRVQALGATAAALRTQGAQLDKLQAEAHKLAATPVPADQAARQRRDVARLNQRVAAARKDVEQTRNALRSALLAIYRERARLTDTWIAFTKDNAYRWRDAAAKRAAYAPVRALGADSTTLEQAYALLNGNDDAALRSAREAMRKALEREATHAPPPGAS